MIVPVDEPSSAPVRWGAGIDIFWEDFQVGEVTQLGTHLMTAEEILEFGRRFDPQPFHADPEAAENSVFHGLIASGFHSAAVWMRLYWDGFLHRAASLGSPGLDDLAWLAPVRPGDRLSASMEVLSTRLSRSRPDRGLVQIRGQLTDQRAVLKLRMTAWGLFGRRPTSDTS